MILNLAGGGAALNFAVKAYAAEDALIADTPKENTIGIITDTPIAGWVFSAAEPSDPTEGLVWIATGTSSTVTFNALKKDAIMVYPLSVRQYLSGVWTKVTAKKYLGGEWADFFSAETLYSQSGGVNIDYAFELTPSTATGTIDDNCVTLKTVASKVNEAYIRFGPYDLTPVSTIRMVCTLESASSESGTVHGVVFASAYTGMSYINAAAIATKSISAAGSKESEQYTVTLDVSDLTGEYYLYCGTHTAGAAWANSRTFRLYELGCYA